MAASIYNQLAWLVETIRSAGRISKEELDKQWEKSSLNAKHEKEYPLRSFHRHREAITKIFGLYICCDRMDGHKYYLSNRTDFIDSEVQLQLCTTLSVANLLIENQELQKRVFFQPVNDGKEHLSMMINAMRVKRAVLITFKKEANMLPIAVIPYALKEHDGKWLIAAKPVDGNAEVQVYSLTDIESATITNLRQSMPRWFNAEVFFASWLEMHQPKAKPAKKEKVADKKARAEKTVKAEKNVDKPVEKKAEKKPAPQEQAQLSLF